ncbi:SCO6880 family protein [Cryobacterium sp. W22_MBD10_FK3]|uniref:SCO6880 family protein n=1 Tax=Cryobacterium sp. W22_MBD10_FK3 TaxID=3240273 RepID=UPI003F93AF61
MSNPEPYVRYLGGETGHRGFFGGTASKTRVFLLAVFIGGGMVGMVMGLGLPALIVAVTGVGITMLTTARTHRGTVLERRRKRARARARRRLGTDEFVPYEVGAWDQLQEAINQGSKEEMRAAERAMVKMRANPDGSDGMGWLQYASNMPGIAWHAPIGEQPYLSVAFSVSGQLRGMETAAALTRAANAWGKFLARRAAPSSLIRDVQTLTRVLPPDSARQQLWVKTRLESVHEDWTAAQRDSFEAQKLSYDEVIRKSSADAMVQRHYVVVSWPLDQQFTDAAAKFGLGRDAWRVLMADQIRATERGLDDAKMGDVRALTAKQTTALMLHQQNPHLPIDLTRTVDPLRAGLRSHDEFSAHVVEDVDPTSLIMGEDGPVSPPVTWWHRTAAIHGENLAVAGRSPLWCLDLLIGRELTFVRSVSFHLHLVPAGQAKAKARADVVRDLAGVMADQQKGRLVSDDSTTRMSAAQRRSADLAAGSHHHGVDWIGFITISAPTRDDLAQASRQLEEACATGLGIERLDWQDSFQSAASGTTWPIGRGLRPAAPTMASRAINRLAGRTEKEALS